MIVTPPPKPAVEVVTPFAKIQLAASKRAAAQASGMSKDETYPILSVISSGPHFKSAQFGKSHLVFPVEFSLVFDS